MGSIPQLEQPNIAGNFLSQYAAAQQRQQQQQALDQKAQQDAITQQRATTQWDQSQTDRALGILGPLVASAKPGDQAGWDQVIGTASKLGVDPTKLAQFKDVATLPQVQQLFAASAPGRAMTNEGRQQQLTEAQIRNLNAEAAKNNAAAANGGFQKAPAGYTWGPAGNLVAIPGGPADPQNKPLSDEQSKALGFASRMQAANSILGGTDATNAETSYGANAAAGVPVIGNWLSGENYQQADQATRDFINAQLRRESGAAIGQSEFDNAYRQYIPRPGDSKALIAQKAAARQRAYDTMMASTGGPRALTIRRLNDANAANPATQDGIQQEYVPGGPPVGTQLPQGGGTQQAPRQLSNRSEYDTLRPGDYYIRPGETQVRRKP